MAAYTVLTKEQLQAVLTGFDVGPLVDFRAVDAGIENTTYFLTFARSATERDHTELDEYVLTIGESIGTQDMQFVAELTTALRADGLPVPAPIRSCNGSGLISIAGKPAVLVPKIEGRPPLNPSTAQCAAMGEALGRLHLSTSKRALAHDSHRGFVWLRDTGNAVLPHLDSASALLLNRSLADLDAFVTAHPALPKAIIHGDLFRDNTLFMGDDLAAIIDFFSAGTGYLLFDLAVTANDWCLGERSQASAEKLVALLSGYVAVRPPTVEEKDCWGEMLAIAALRFWISRLADRIFPSALRHNVPLKDPVLYEQLLLAHRTAPLSWR